MSPGHPFTRGSHFVINETWRKCLAPALKPLLLISCFLSVAEATVCCKEFV